jgi:hypothetical protein
MDEKGPDLTPISKVYSHGRSSLPAASSSVTSSRLKDAEAKLPHCREIHDHK